MMEHGVANVLLVANKPGDADLVHLRLLESKCKFNVNCVTRLSDALTWLDVETPSLVLLDPNLPTATARKPFAGSCRRLQTFQW